ncbi:MAG: hypothetical protein AB8B81_17090 [Halioglobus sp.]
MFTNKHVVIAFIVAPILSVLAWFAVGNLMGEQPHRAAPGAAYPLIARSNCRYASGRCDLENEDFKLAIKMEDARVLELSSEHPLRGVLVSVGDAAKSITPSSMSEVAKGGTHWRLQLTQNPEPEDVIRLVAATKDNSYYGETALEFVKP